MKRKMTYSAIAIFGLAISGLLIGGCSTGTPTVNGGTTAAATPVESGGAQLWAQNCGHCHNIRSPSSLSDAQWEVAALHMRVRANLTAEEHRKILAFLKSSH